MSQYQLERIVLDDKLCAHKKALSIHINASIPFVPSGESASAHGSEGHCWQEREIRLFEEINENLVPLCRAFENLSRDKIHWKIALSLSPILTCALTNDYLMKRYKTYLAAQIKFGQKEYKKTMGNKKLKTLLDYYINYFSQIEEYLKSNNYDIIKIIKNFKMQGHIEILASTATNPFLPFYVSFPKAVSAQIAEGLNYSKKLFEEDSAGLYLPSMAYHPALDDVILDNKFNYTIIDSSGFLRANPDRGTFYPCRTKKGLLVFANDFILTREFLSFTSELYRDNSRDAGYELSYNDVEVFCGEGGERYPTGYKYWQIGEDAKNTAYYDPVLAQEEAGNAAKRCAIVCAEHLENAARLVKDASPVSVISFDIDNMGRRKKEGAFFLENFFRQISETDIFITTPYEFLVKDNAQEFEMITPLYSHAADNVDILCSKNDWIYRHTFRAIERMEELASQFEDAGIIERFLNQACRELFLAQNAHLALLLTDEHTHEGAKAEINQHIRNFTAIYESLGNRFISAKRLALLETRNYILPDLNYRIFRCSNETAE